MTTTYRPLPYRPGNTVVRQYVEPFDDGAGHSADVTKVDYIDKKGRRVTGYTLLVKWHGAA